MSKITNRIFLGNFKDACDYDFISNNDIKLVINLAEEVPISYNLNIKHLHYFLKDVSSQIITDVIYSVYDHMVNFFKSSDGNVLFHCYAGVSRSASVLIGFLMLYSNISLGDAYSFVKSRRRIIKPNIGFIRQLECLKPLGIANQIE